MIKNWLCTGDTHGHVCERLEKLNGYFLPSETALIILGDAGLNFYLNKTDSKNKVQISATGYTIYCVRGNHEERPENIFSMEEYWDYEVEGYVWYEPEFPNIKYLKDGEEYIINKMRTLVIGGAYSVDKWHRLNGAPADAKWTGWFKDEQLTETEMREITDRVAGRNFDLVLSHTCPYSWQPFDLFLPFVDQSSVDKSMELWLEELKEKISFNQWIFGHFHQDRIINEQAQMLFSGITELKRI